MSAVFVPSPDDHLYDLLKDGRVLEYNVDPDDLQGAIRRARLNPDEVLIEDETGHATRMGR